MKNIVIVLDIDRTLVNTGDDTGFEKYKKLNLFGSGNIQNRKNIYNLSITDAVGHPGSGYKTEMSGVIRPHIDEFLRFCFDNFRVIVWSAGKDRYVHTMCDILFPLYSEQPEKILTYNDCVVNKRDLTKPLSKLFDDEIGAHNILVIDDTASTFSLNKENAIHIPPYEFSLNDINRTADNDDRLLQVQKFLKEHILNCKDVRKVDKSRIFH